MKFYSPCGCGTGTHLHLTLTQTDMYLQGMSKRSIDEAPADYPFISNNGAVPATPKSVTATTNQINKVVITWGTASGATRYEVWRWRTNLSTWATRLSSNGTSPFSDTSGTVDQTYNYWVKGCNSVGCSGFSTHVIGNSIPQPPITPHYVYLPVVVNASSTEPPFTHVFYIEPTLSPGYTGDLCTTGWLRINGWQSDYSYLTLNTNQSAEAGYTATYSLTVEKTGKYRISNWVADHSPIGWSCPTKIVDSDSSHNPFRVNHAGGQTIVYVNQLPIADDWATVGTYTFNAGTVYKIIIFDLNTEADWSTTISAGTLRAEYVP